MGRTLSIGTGIHSADAKDRGVSMAAEAEDVRTLALALPGTEERVTWNQPTFRVSGKIFA